MLKHPLNNQFNWVQPSGPYQVIGDAEANAYRNEGGFVLKGAFSRAELDELIIDLDRLEEEANEAARSIPPGQPTIARADEIIFCAHLVARSEVARRFSMHPILVRLCEDLIGPKVRLYWDQLVYKRPGTADEFPWHQDNGYTFVEPQQYLTCWVALNDATIENGCPWIAPGMHRGGTLRHEWTDLGFRCLADFAEAQPLPVSAGSIAVFSSLTPHRTGPNLTADVRKTYILQYAPDGAVVYPRGGEPVLANAADRQYMISGPHAEPSSG